MGFFYDREESEEQIIICLKKWAWFYIFLFAALICAFLGRLFDQAFFIGTAIFLILMISLVIPFWPLLSQVNKAMRRGPVRISGSKFSLSNPLTFVIPKTKQQQTSENQI